MQLENGLHADVYALEIIIPVAFRDVYKRQDRVNLSPSVRM